MSVEELWLAWEEYEATEADRCAHGALPEEYCEDCDSER